MAGLLEGDALARPRGWRGAVWLAAGIAAISVSASAQGIYPGGPSKDGYKLPGGFEPVVHLRTYYLDGESHTGAESAAWALGGWAGVRSPWWGDALQVGIVGYTSLKLYGPEDKDGTSLLGPGQENIAVIGEAFAALRIAGQTLAGYRQLINRPFINPQDNRMVPNTFEAYTLTGSEKGVAYTGGYITKMKARTAESFKWMSTTAGAAGTEEGVYYAGATWDFTGNGYVKVDLQYAVDVFSTFYVEAKVPVALDERTTLTLGAQYYPQKAVGDERIGSFSTYGLGLQAAVARGPFGLQLYYTQMGTGFDTQNPFGSHATYLDLQQQPFKTAGERAWGIGGNVNFASLGIPGLTASAIYGAGTDRVVAATGSALPDHSETNVRADYTVGKGSVLAGLVATIRYSWLKEDGAPQSAPQLRIYANYPISF